MIKQTLKKMLGSRLLGVYDYFVHPESKKVWGGAFNGQEFRRKIYSELMERNDFSQIVETGTFKGNTTAYMAKTGLPIKSAEYDERNFGYCQFRFLLNKDVSIYQGDSRQFLRSLTGDKSIKNEMIFFYLDAHWNEDLPLAEELDIIFSHWDNMVIMIDDFKVPDTGYNYDDYGKGKALTLEYLKKTRYADKYQIFFPAKDETHETSVKRGCVVLTGNQEIAKQLSQMQTLRHYPNF